MDKTFEQKYTIHRSLDLKISEVKNVFSGEKQQNTYCTVHINDDEVRRTPTVYNNTSPIFSEHFEFNPLIPNFNQLKIMVWSDVTETNDKNLNNNNDDDELSFQLSSTILGDKAVGQIIFPLAFLKSGAFQKEQWFVLQPTFDNINKYNVTGDIRIEVSHTLNPDKTHRFEINVKQAFDLIRDSNGGLPDPYVACYLLPDIEGKTAQLTTVKKNTINPVFNSKIVYNVENVTENLEINVSIWNWNKLSTNEFLGHCFVLLSDIPVNSSIDKRYPLLAKPARIYHSMKNKGKGTLKTKKRFTMVDGDTKINHRQFIQRLQRSDQKDNVPTTKRSHRLLDTKFYSISFCGHCGGIIWVTKTHLKCGNCNFCCHQQCAKYVSDNCGGVVTLLLKITYNESYVLPIEYYNSFLNVINENKYYLIELFGKLSTERENAALSLIKIQLKHDNLFDCLKSLIEIEVSESDSSQTLFRANSMVSKIIDVYMKFTGLEYLSAILKDIIHTIVENDFYIEVDPSKLPEQKKINESIYNLTKYLENILNSIFSAEQSLPKDWRIIFSYIQKNVIEKFPTEYNVRYTSIAGFIFLRFFAPSILGPKLFGLIKTYVNEKSTRTFTLLAKVIQTLANLSDFNEKELYMCPLNDYIHAKLPYMKKYLTDICNEDVESQFSSEMLNQACDQLIAYECSKLLKYFTNIESKLIESITSENVLLLKKYIDVSTNLMEYVNELKKNDELMNEERLKKKKVSEDFTAKMSNMSLGSEKTYVYSGGNIYDHKKSNTLSDLETNEKRSSTASLLSDENIKYISEYYKTTGVGDSIIIRKHSHLNESSIAESSDETELDSNLKLKDQISSRETLVPKPKPSEHSVKITQPLPKLSDQKKTRDRNKVLSMLGNIPQLGSFDFNNFQHSKQKSTNDIDFSRQLQSEDLFVFDTPGKTSNLPPSSIFDVQKKLATANVSSPFDPQRKSSTANTTSPFDTTRRASTMNTTSPFDTTRRTSILSPSSPFDPPRKPSTIVESQPTTPSSPFDSSKRTSTISPNSPFDTSRRTSTLTPNSPFDDSRRTSTTNSSSPFDTSKRASIVNPASPFDSPRKPSTINESEPSTPLSPFDTPRKASTLTSNSPLDTSRRTSTLTPNSPFGTSRRTSTLDSSSPFETPKITLDENEEKSSSSTEEKKEKGKVPKEEDLIPSIPHQMSTLDCNEFDQAQGCISPLTVTSTNNPLDQEETVDIPESEITDEIYSKISQDLKYCFMCRMQVLTEYITFDNEKFFHPDCFRCQRCDEILTNNNCYRKEEKYYCKKCYLFEEGYCCNECEEIIEGQAININGKLYHQNCFVCNACGDKLNKQYLVIDGRPYCKRDYLKYKGFMCGICGEFIENEYITIFDRKYHLNCKRCSLCGESFNNKSFFSLPQDPYEVYCERHKTELCTCHRCNQSIGDQMIRTVKNPLSYHVHCFKCIKCDKSLQNSDYFGKDNEVYCKNCYISTFL
ncbi:hypothetical protein BCR32DRAFT_270638 [Anaeromyces robustus]|uniref:Rho GTPase activation protein n=1 Tax=Anaeromyces robustus TaxID=1754192 RepID=A0A1Y1WW95_9FUNG|nr:hypothetical protein BCR32DRAFT_270638 [Anaeromyces robustus]|eukprot:ORX77476.1 hypothetical protein BCR32DRAFT_270638 [Anaeromyces robustus]